MAVKHLKVSTREDGPDPTKVRPSDWNADHVGNSSFGLLVAASNASAKALASADYVCDGIADQTEINAAITALPLGGTVYLSEGTFTCNGSILNRTQVELVGSGWGTILKVANSANINLLTLNTTTTEYVRLANFQVDGNKANQSSGHGIFWDQTGSGFGFSHSDPMHVIEHLLIVNCKQDGVRWVGGAPRGSWIDKVSCYSNDGVGFTIQGSDNLMTDCIAGHSGLQGYNIGPNAGFLMMQNCKAFDSGLITPTSGQGFKTISTFGTFANCHAQDNAYDGFSIEWTDSTLIGCMADSNGILAGTHRYGFHIAGDRTELSNCHGVDSGNNKQAYGFHIATGVVKVKATGITYNNITGSVLNDSGAGSVDVSGILAW